MLNLAFSPDIMDLANLCRQSLDAAELLEQAITQSDLRIPDDKARREWEKAISTVSILTMLLRDITALANVLDGYEQSEKYGFPPLKSEPTPTGSGADPAGNAGRCEP